LNFDKGKYMQADLAYIPSKRRAAVSIISLPITIMAAVGIVYWVVGFMRFDPSVAEKLALWVGLPASWFIYFKLLLERFWIAVALEEVILEDTFSFENRGIADQVDPLALPSGLRSIGGPGFRAKGFFENVKARLPVVSQEKSGSLEVDDQNTSTFNVKYSMTYTRVRGRYSVIGYTYKEEEAIKTLEAIVEAQIEELFANELDGRNIRAKLDERNKELSKVLGGDRSISHEEIRCGFFLTKIRIKTVDEAAATKQRNQAQALAVAVKEAAEALSQGAGSGVDPNLLMALAASAAGVKGDGVKVNIVKGLEKGGHYVGS